MSRSAAVARPDLVINAETAKAGGAFADLVPTASEPKRGFTPLSESAPQAMAGEVQKSWAPGANYAPLIDDSLAPASAATPTAAGRGKPIRREDIIVPFGL